MPAEHVGRSAAVPDRVTLGSLRIPDLVAKLGGEGRSAETRLAADDGSEYTPRRIHGLTREFVVF